MKCASSRCWRRWTRRSRLTCTRRRRTDDRGTTAPRAYPPARWRGGSSDAAKLRSEGLGELRLLRIGGEALHWLRASGAPPPRPLPATRFARGGRGAEWRRDTKADMEG